MRRVTLWGHHVMLNNLLHVQCKYAVLCLKPEPLNLQLSAMLQQLQRGNSRARALNTTKDSYGTLRVYFQGDRAGAI